MQVMITHGSTARTRVLQFSRWQLGLAGAALVLLLLAVSGAVYHFVFLKAAREGWPVVSQLVRLVVRDEIEQRERFMRENLDVMAQRVGEMQAKVVKLETMGERVARMVNIKPEEIKPVQRPAGSGAVSGADTDLPLPALAPTPGGGKGGPYVPLSSPLTKPSLQQLQAQLAALDETTDFHTDLYTLFESRLLESTLSTLTIPSEMPLHSPHTSGFGFRTDPFSGRQALHTGLDFPAEVGASIRAAAGGIVANIESHPSYGEMLEIDHGNGVITRYAHCSSIDVKLGAVVKPGQAIAKVGNTGRSTGPHLHFEVLVGGVPRDPVRFLAGAARAVQMEFAARPAPK